MRKIVMSTVALLVVASVANAEIINWGGASFLNDKSGTIVSANWLAEIYVDSGANNSAGWQDALQVDKSGSVVSLGFGTDDDALLGVVGSSTLTADFGGGFITILGGSPTVAANANLYTIVFNADTIADATQSFVYDLDPFVVPVGSGVGTVTPAFYGVGSPTAAGQWNVVVPEPATIGLLGVAGLGMFLARKKVRA